MARIIKRTWTSRGPTTAREAWSRGRELNPRPIDYESIALPLSYPGVSRAGREKRVRV